MLNDIAIINAYAGDLPITPEDAAEVAKVPPPIIVTDDTPPEIDPDAPTTPRQRGAAPE